ncbi:MAG: amidoligase family protein [Gammaproteobacteria bacterium]|nr:amidoligase family protein [Gammaproteobacteria bacterium]
MDNPPSATLDRLLKRTDGEVRRLGVELEFSGLDIGTISEAVRAELGGSVRVISDYEQEIGDTEFGTFRIELDFAYLKQLGRESAPDTLPDDMERLPERILAAIAEQVVPFEIVSPPMPMDRIDALEPLSERLRKEGALGTRHSAVYAFGLHLNPELPDLGAETVTAYLQAFMCLYPWLERAGEVDWSRRLTTYIQPYSKDYILKVIDADYRPGTEQLIDDYLEANPDRNRALDMLPLFAHLDEARVRRAVDDERIKARPTLHYRLPNCDIDNPQWTISTPWRQWLQVEFLAADRERLDQICAGYREYLGSRIAALTSDWSRDCERWLVAPDGAEKDG